MPLTISISTMSQDQKTPELNLNRNEALIESIVSNCFDQHPELPARYGAKGRSKCVQDTRFHLQYLSEAVANGSPALFIDYVGWAKVMLKGVNVPEKDLEANLRAMRSALEGAGPEFIEATNYVDQAIGALPAMANEVGSFIRRDSPLFPIASKYLDFLLLGDRRQASQLTLDAVENGTSVKDIYLHVFQPAQREIGRLWQTNRITVAQEHFCTAATQLIMSQLYPKIFNTAKNGYRMVATCVGSELHEIGVRMVADFFEMEGWDSFYLGANVPPLSVTRTLADRQSQILAISATMTYHLDGVSALIRAVRSDQALENVRILVGGYPFNVEPNLWKKLGADGYGVDAEDSEKLARSLLK